MSINSSSINATAVNSGVEEIQLSGTATTSLSSSGNLTNSFELTGSIKGSLQSSGSIANTSRLVGKIDSGLESKSDLKTSTNLSGQVSSGSKLKSDITISKFLSGTAQSNLTASSSLSKRLTVSGTIEGGSKTSSEISLSKLLSGTSESGAKTSSNLTSSTLLNGKAEPALNISGSLTASLYTEPTPQELSSRARKTAVDFLSLIDDPTSRVRSSFIYNSKPRVKAQDFDGYPFIVLEEYTINDISRTVNGLLTELDVDLEFHVYGLEDSEEDIENFDRINDEIQYLVLGPERVRLGREAKMARTQFLRQNRFTGIDEKDQPYVRKEFEIRGKLHIDMTR